MITHREWQEIHRLVKQMATVILSGNTAETSVDGVVGTESIDNLVPGNPTIDGRPVAHPYGLMSRAPKGTVQVTARQGDHPANRLVLLHRDANRPNVAEGDTWLYDQHGNQVKLENGKIVMKLASKLELGEGATKLVARKTDTVKVTIPIGAITLAVSGASATGPSAPIDVTGTITGGSANVTCVD